MLVDPYQRQFHYLRLSITDVCNFKCNYCLPEGYECQTDRDFLTLKEIKHLVQSFADLGVSKIRITGGEPGLRKDLPEIIHTIKQIKGIETVALTTNGYNLEKNIQHWVDAGLDALNVSIDSLNAETFKLITGSHRHQSIMNGLEKALRLGMTQVKVNAVLLKQFNANEMAQFLLWLKDTPVSLRFIELMQTGDNKGFFEDQHVNGQKLMQEIEDSGWLPIIKSKNAGPAKEFYHPNYAGRIGFILPYSSDFCVSCNRLRVSATGNLHLCLFAEEGQNLRHLLQSEQDNELRKQWLRDQLKIKKSSHSLHEQQVGATKHLAMLGG